MIVLLCMVRQVVSLSMMLLSAGALDDMLDDFWKEVSEGFTFLSDTFTGADNTLIENHTPERGGPWLRATPDAGPPTAGTVRILGNQLAFTLAAEGAVVDIEQSDAYLEVDYIPQIGSRSGVMLRHVSNGNTLVLRLRVPESLIEILPFTGGAPATTIASSAFTYTAGQTYRIKILAKGTRISVYVDDVLTVAGDTTAHATGTRFGLTSFGSDLLERFDNIIIQDTRAVSGFSDGFSDGFG